METAWDVVPALVGTLLGSALCACLTRRVQPVWVLAAALYFVLDMFAVIQAPHIHGTHWNWAGKLFSIVLALLVVLALRLSREEVGLILPKTRLAWRWTGIGIAAALLFAGTVNYFFRDHKIPSIETLLYQATMPGLSEELAFRGVGFALLQRAFGMARDRWSALPPVLVPSLVFALGHGYSHDNGSFHFFWISFIYSLILGLWFAWIRLRTGSLLGPVLGHNTANTAGSWLSGLR